MVEELNSVEEVVIEAEEGLLVIRREADIGLEALVTRPEALVTGLEAPIVTRP